MATITLTIPDAALPRVVAALCRAAGLPVTGPNAKASLILWIKTTVRNIEASDAEQARAPLVPPDVSGIVT